MLTQDLWPHCGDAVASNGQGEMLLSGEPLQLRFAHKARRVKVAPATEWSHFESSLSNWLLFNWGRLQSLLVRELGVERQDRMVNAVAHLHKSIC